MPFVTTEQFAALVARVARAELLTVDSKAQAAKIVKIYGPIAAYNSVFGFSQDSLPGDDDIIGFFTPDVLLNNVTEKYIYENKDTLLDDLLSLKKYDEETQKNVPLFDSIENIVADISGGELGKPSAWVGRKVYSFNVHGEKIANSCNRKKYNLTATIASDAGVLKLQKVIYDDLTDSDTRKSEQLSNLKTLLKFSGDYSSICVPTAQYADEDAEEEYWISVADVVVAISKSRGKETLANFGASLTFPRDDAGNATAKKKLIDELINKVEWGAAGYHVCVPEGEYEPEDHTIGLNVVVGLGFVTQKELVNYLLTSGSETLVDDLATVGFGDLSLDERIAIISALDADDVTVSEKIALVLSTLNTKDKAVDVLKSLLEAFTLGKDDAPDLLTLADECKRKLTPDQVALFSMITVINDSSGNDLTYSSFSDDVDYSVVFNVKCNGDIVEVFKDSDYNVFNFLTLSEDDSADVNDKTVIKVLKSLGLYTVAYISGQFALLGKKVPEAFKQLKNMFGLAAVLANENFLPEVSTAAALVEYLEKGDNTIITEINSVTEWLKTETGIAQMHDVADEAAEDEDAADKFATAAALLIADGVDAELVWEALQSADAENNPDQAITSFLKPLIGAASDPETSSDSKLLYGLLRAVGVAGCLAGLKSSRQFTEEGNLVDNWVLAFTDKVYWEELKSAGFTYAELLTYFETVKIVQFKNGVGFSEIYETKVFAFDLIELGAFYGLSNDEITSIARQLGYVIDLDSAC